MIHDLNELMRNVDPSLEDNEYLFCSVTVAERKALAVEPIFEFIESEGVSVVITREDADRHGLSGQFPSRMIKLRAYSSLYAVGFLAAITARLANQGISVQAVSAFHHDYLFVPVERAGEALDALRQVASARSEKTRRGS